MEMTSRRRRARNANCGATGETLPTNVARRAAPTTTSSSIVPERMDDVRGRDGGDWKEDKYSRMEKEESGNGKWQTAEHKDNLTGRRLIF